MGHYALVGRLALLPFEEAVHKVVNHTIVDYSICAPERLSRKLNNGNIARDTVEESARPM